MAIDRQMLNDALDALVLSKGISKEDIVFAIKEAMVRGYRKQLGGDDAQVIANVDPDTGKFELFYVLNIVKNVEDDFLEISKEDALIRVENKEGFISTLSEVDETAVARRDTLKVEYETLNGNSESLLEDIYNAEEAYKTYDSDIVKEKFFMPADLDLLKKATVNSIKAVFKQKTSEIEKNALFATFSNKIEHNITGKVESYDERGCMVDIGKASVYLPRSFMIGRERYRVGDDIRVYVDKVETTSKGATLVITRSNEKFLKCLFKEEISEIFDGTIEIKEIARAAGERSKVAVWSKDPNVDPAGACIGASGNRISNIANILNKNRLDIEKESKEKIDVIRYYDNKGLFVMEALKPARLAGVIIKDDTHAVAVVKDDSFASAVGRKGVNVHLAAKLTKCNIDIITETEAINQGLEYQTFEQLQSKMLEDNAKIIREAYNVSTSNDVLPGLPNDYVAPQNRVYEDEKTDMDVSLEEVAEDDNDVESEKEVREVETVKEVAEEESVHLEVKTTMTLSDLEKSLEGEDTSSTKQTKKFNKKKNEKEETVVTTVRDSSKDMYIYSDEDMEEIDSEDYDDEESFADDWDDSYDEYYDDDDR